MNQTDCFKNKNTSFYVARAKKDLDESCENLLNVDESACNRLTDKLMRIIDSDENQKITKDEMELYTKHLVRSVTPGRTFNKSSFDKGFSSLDPEGRGYCKFE